MSIRKKIICGCASVLFVGLLSNVAFAASKTDYDFRLPTTGSRVTNDVTKPSKDTTGYNYAKYVGWEGSGIECWIENISSSRLSATSSYSSTGTINMYYDKNLAVYYYGHPVHMKIKTDGGTWHECDVRGTFVASY